MDAPLPSADRALVEYADHLTRHSHLQPEARLDRLRAAGFSDSAILAATEVAGYFNFINRMASGLCVELEPEFEP